MAKKYTQEEFIARAIAKHGEGRYDYSMVKYVKIAMPHFVIIARNTAIG